MNNYKNTSGRVFTKQHILNSDARISCQCNCGYLCQKSHFRSYAGTVRKQSDAACGFLAFVPREHSFHCQCCKLKTMFTGRYPLTQSDIEQMYDLVQTSDQGVNKKRCFAGPDTMNKEELVGDIMLSQRQPWLQ